MLKGIVFDLDGTLVDSLKLTFDAFNHGIASAGGRIHSRAEISRYFGKGELQIFADITGADRAPDAYEAYHEYFATHLHQVTRHDGVSELLTALGELGISCGIFTGRGNITTRMILDHFGWTHRFAAVASNDHVEHSKPSPHGLLLATHLMGLRLKDILYVGDSAVDILAARSARAISVAALWDENAKHDRTEQYNPDFRAPHPSEVLRVLRKMNGTRISARVPIAGPLASTG